MCQNVEKNNRFSIDFTSSVVWGSISFWKKNLSKKKSNTDHHFESRLVNFFVIFWASMRSRLCQGGFGKALDEHGVSKRNKGRAKFIDGAQKWRFWVPLGERNREGADHMSSRLPTLARQRVGGLGPTLCNIHLQLLPGHNKRPKVGNITVTWV